MWLRPAIFLDRDGTLNRDFGYVHKIADWQWLPGAIDALRKFQASGYRLVVASNQSGLARGYYSAEQLQMLEDWLNAQLQQQDIVIDAWRYCPHWPDAGCLCRKPRPGMLLQAARDLNIDLTRSWMIGDKISDIEAGKNAGCKYALIAANQDQDERQVLTASYPQLLICDSLADAATQITGTSG